MYTLMPNNDQYLRVLGDRIKRARISKRKLTQAQLAAHSGISKTYLNAIEHGRANPSINILHSIAFNLEISVGRLLKDIDN